MITWLLQISDKYFNWLILTNWLDFLIFVLWYQTAIKTLYSKIYQLCVYRNILDVLLYFYRYGTFCKLKTHNNYVCENHLYFGSLRKDPNLQGYSLGFKSVLEIRTEESQKRRGCRMWMLFTGFLFIGQALCGLLVVCYINSYEHIQWVEGLGVTDNGYWGLRGWVFRRERCAGTHTFWYRVLG